MAERPEPLSQDILAQIRKNRRRGLFDHDLTSEQVERVEQLLDSFDQPGEINPSEKTGWPPGVDPSMLTWPSLSAPTDMSAITDAEYWQHTPVTAYLEGRVVRSDTPLGEALDVWADTGLRLSDVALSPIRGLVGKRVRVTVEVLGD